MCKTGPSHKQVCGQRKPYIYFLSSKSDVVLSLYLSSWGQVLSSMCSDVTMPLILWLHSAENRMPQWTGFASLPCELNSSSAKKKIIIKKKNNQKKTRDYDITHVKTSVNKQSKVWLDANHNPIVRRRPGESRQLSSGAVKKGAIVLAGPAQKGSDVFKISAAVSSVTPSASASWAAPVSDLWTHPQSPHHNSIKSKLSMWASQIKIKLSLCVSNTYISPELPVSPPANCCWMIGS